MRRILRNILLVGLVLLIALFISMILSVVSQQNRYAAVACWGILVALGLAGLLLWSRDLGKTLRRAAVIQDNLNSVNPASCNQTLLHNTSAEVELARQNRKAAQAKVKLLTDILIVAMVVKLLLHIVVWFAR